MRRLFRRDLPPRTAAALARYQGRADAKWVAGPLNTERCWKSARRSKAIQVVQKVLEAMVGPRQRCMYCCDSRGADIERFWPKSRYPDRMFGWTNLLLACTECGRIKGTEFPLQNGKPLLVDPTAEDPWRHLDFDPTTGNLVPRFHSATATWDRKGEETVRVLELDRREALARGYQATYRRLRTLVTAALRRPPMDEDRLLEELRQEDDHGLLGWCFTGTGQHLSPFGDLLQRHPGLPRRWMANPTVPTRRSSKGVQPGWSSLGPAPTDEHPASD